MQSKSLTSSDVVQENGRFLRNVLRANAIFSTVSGFFVVVFAKSIAQLIGLENPLLLVGLGIGLLPFAFFVYKVATMPTVNTKLVWVVIELDSLWVVGSVLLLLSNIVPFTTTGKWIIALLAEMVAIFAIFQVVGLRKMKRDG